MNFLKLSALFVILMLSNQSVSAEINLNNASYQIENSTFDFSQLQTDQFDFTKPHPVKLLNFFSRLKRKIKLNPRATAIALTITLGPFGAHRIYLGTSYTVPIFYTLTLGGGLLILPISDLLLLIFTKDISKYYNNTHIFMWDTNE